LEGVREKVGAWGEAFGGCAESGPPTRTGFLEEEKFCPVPEANETGRDYLGVVEDEKIVFFQETRQIYNMMILNSLSRSIKKEEASGVARRGGGQCDLGGRQMIRK